MDNPYIALLKQAQTSGLPYDTTTESLEDYDLGGVDCEKCGNTGHIAYYKDGILYSRECECMNRRRSMKRIRRSGMTDLLERYTFDSFKTPDETRLKIKISAERFADSDDGWFYIAGQSGSGKTHICTAICKRLIERNRNVYYMAWRDESRSLKANMNSFEIEEPIRKLKTVKVLYIDDFFKGGVSDPDIRLAFEILNARYNDTSLRTIISTELDIKKLLEIDEALGSRVYERARGHIFQAPKENWRLR